VQFAQHVFNDKDNKPHKTIIKVDQINNPQTNIGYEEVISQAPITTNTGYEEVISFAPIANRNNPAVIHVNNLQSHFGRVPVNNSTLFTNPGIATSRASNEKKKRGRAEFI